MAGGIAGAARQLLAVFTFDVDAKPLKKGEKSLEDFARTASKIMKAMAGGAIGYAIKGFVDNTLDEMIAIKRAAGELRITTDEMQGVKAAARSLGIDVKWLHFSMERLQISTELAARGSKRQAASMKLVGLTTHDANGKIKNAYELFMDVAAGLSKLKDPNKQAIAVWDLFGRGAHRLLPFLRSGKENIAALAKELLSYGKYSKETLDKAAAFRVELERGNMAWTGLKNIIFGQVLPVLERWAKRTREGILWIREMTKRSLLFDAALYVVSTGLTLVAAKMAIVNWQVSLAVIGIGLLIGGVDDLMVWFAGGDSLFGRALKAIGGEELNTAVLTKVKEIWRDIRDRAREVVEAMRKAGWLPEDKGPEIPYSSVAQHNLAARQEKKRVEEQNKADAESFETTGYPADAPAWKHALGAWAQSPRRIAQGIGHQLGRVYGSLPHMRDYSKDVSTEPPRTGTPEYNYTDPGGAGQPYIDPNAFSGDINLTIIVPEQGGVHKQSIKSANATRKRKAR